MSGHQKTPLSRTLPLLVDAFIRKQQEKLGRALPCRVEAVDPTSAVVTVSFQLGDIQIPQVTMPVAGAEYIRYPIQVGCLGGCLAFDTFMGQITGQGSGVANTTRRANLSTLMFVPMGNVNWTATDDANSVVIYGPNGVILRDSDSKTVVTLTPDGVDIAAQHNVTVEADTKIEATVGSNSVLLDTGKVLLTVGSDSVLINSTEIVLTIGGATMTMTASGIVSTVPITAPAVTATGAVTGATMVAATSLKVGGEEMSGHQHHVAGITTGGSTVTTSAPI